MNYSTTPGLAPGTGANVGKSIKVRGEITGAESLQFDGELEGSIDLTGNLLVVGVNARLNANIAAKQVVIHGRVNGNVNASDVVEIRSSAIIVGEIVTSRLTIEDGALIKGRVNIKREAQAALGLEPERPVMTMQAAAQALPVAQPAVAKSNI